MSLESRLVENGFMLLAGKTLTARQAGDCADLYGSKQELVAHLLTKELMCRTSPAIVAELITMAQVNYTAPQTVRPGFIDYHRRRVLQSEMVSLHRVAVRELVALEQTANALRNTSIVFAESDGTIDRLPNLFAPFVLT